MDLISDLPSYYFMTILHLGALFKSQHGVIRRVKNGDGEVAKDPRDI